MEIQKIKDGSVMQRIICLLSILLFTTTCCFSQETYKIGNTEYYFNQTYSTTGKPMVKRSETNKQEFLRNRGYDAVPQGYEIDHIMPLSEGGTDDPSNMQLITAEEHARKTVRERANNSISTSGGLKQHNSTSTINSTFEFSMPNNGSERAIYTGPNGGKYYINSNGNKTYIKSETSSTSTSTKYKYTPSTPSYSTTRTIYTGPKGGQYYINSNGNKTYIKK